MNPKKTKGKVSERNLNCPRYKKCLDHAAVSWWKGFDCAECEFFDIEYETLYDNNVYGDIEYPVSPDLNKERL